MVKIGWRIRGSIDPQLIGNSRARQIRLRCSRVCLAITVTLFGTIFASQHASAYQLLGCKWSHRQIKLSVAAPLASYSAWTGARGAWGGLDANFVLNSTDPDVYGTNENRGNTVIWTGATRKKGTVNTFPPCANGLWTSGRMEVVINWSLVNQLHYSAAWKKMVAAHELGHAFGLDHTPNHQEWLMYPTDQRYALLPQPNDKAGVNAIY